MRLITLLTLISCIGCGDHETSLVSTEQDMNRTQSYSVNELTQTTLSTDEFAQTRLQSDTRSSSPLIRSPLPILTQQNEYALQGRLRPTSWSRASRSWPNQITDSGQDEVDIEDPQTEESQTEESQTEESQTEESQTEESHGGYFVGLVAQDPQSNQLRDGLASGHLHLQGAVIRRSKGIIDWNFGRGVGLGHADWISQSTTEDALVLVIEGSDETEWYLGFSLQGVTRIEEGADIEVIYISAERAASGVEEITVIVDGALRMTAVQGFDIDLSEQGIKLQAGEKISGPQTHQPCAGSSHALHLTQRGKEVRLMPGQSHTVDAQSLAFGQWTQSSRNQGCNESDTTIRVAVGY